MKSAILAALAALALSAAGPAVAQTPNPPQSSTPVAVSDLSGPYPVVMEMDPTLPDHTVYRPADMSAPGRALPVVAYGAGACLNIGNWTPQFLGELASRGYLVVSGGPIIEGADTPSAPTAGVPDVSQNRTAQLLETIDWAIAQNDITGEGSRALSRRTRSPSWATRAAGCRRSRRPTTRA